MGEDTENNIRVLTSSGVMTPVSLNFDSCDSKAKAHQRRVATLAPDCQQSCCGVALTGQNQRINTLAPDPNDSDTNERCETCSCCCDVDISHQPPPINKLAAAGLTFSTGVRNSATPSAVPFTVLMTFCIFRSLPWDEPDVPPSRNDKPLQCRFTYLAMAAFTSRDLCLEKRNHMIRVNTSGMGLSRDARR